MKIYRDHPHHLKAKALSCHSIILFHVYTTSLLTKNYFPLLTCIYVLFGTKIIKILILNLFDTRIHINCSLNLFGTRISNNCIMQKQQPLIFLGYEFSTFSAIFT